MTLYQLKKRAKAHDLSIHSCYRSGLSHDDFMLVDIATNTLAAPAPMTLAQVESWLDDLDDQKRIEDLKERANKQKRNYETR